MSGMDVFQEGLSYGGFIPGLGAVPDLINAPIYAVRGKWGEAAWSLGAAVPVVGDGANGIRKGRKIYHAIDEAADAGRAVDNVTDARRVAARLARGRDGQVPEHPAKDRRLGRVGRRAWTPSCAGPPAAPARTRPTRASSTPCTPAATPRSCARSTTWARAAT